MERDMITDLAHLVHPHPRADEVDPPEAYPEAAELAAQQRGEWELNLRGFVDETGEDPLLATLAEFAEQRDDAEQMIRTLLAYGGRALPGRGYSWPRMAAAAGLNRNTAERRVTDEVVADVRTRLLPREAEEPQPVLASREQVAQWHDETLERLAEHPEIIAEVVRDVPGYWALSSPDGQTLGEEMSHTLSDLHARGVRLRRSDGDLLTEFDWTTERAHAASRDAEGGGQR